MATAKQPQDLTQNPIGNLLLQIMDIERRFASDHTRGKKERQAEIRRLIEKAAASMHPGTTQ